MRERRLSRAQAIMLLTRSIFHKKLRKQGMLIRAFLAHFFFFIYARIFRKCVICNLQDSSMEFGSLECRSASHTEKILSWLRKRESYKLFLKKRLRVFIIIFFFLKQYAFVTRLMDRLTQAISRQRSMSRTSNVYDGGGGGGGSFRRLRFPEIKGSRATAQTDGGSRGIHILKAAGTRLQQGVPLTLFIHLRSSGAGAAVAEAGAHGACHQVPI